MNLIVSRTIRIKVEPMMVWKALTDTATIKKYFFGTEAVSDWKAGSPLVFRGEWEGRSYEDKGTILDAEPGKVLKYSYWSGFSGLEDIPDNYSLVTYTLESENQDTLLILVQQGFANEEALAHSESGWDKVLQNLKELLESH